MLQGSESVVDVALALEDLGLFNLADGQPQRTVVVLLRVVDVSISGGRGGVLHLLLVLLLQQLPEVVGHFIHWHHFYHFRRALSVRLFHFDWILFEQQLLRFRSR